MSAQQAFDLKGAISSPSQFFTTPNEVLLRREISRNDKIRILRQWETDARLLEVAEEENMGSGEANQLAEVKRCILALED